MIKIIKLDKNILYNYKNPESFIARQGIEKYINQKVKVDIDWKPIFENGIFWSISHKTNLIFIWFTDRKIWIDIEIIKTRWKEIYNLHKIVEYHLLWNKNLENFYRLWTIKESVIKLNLSWIDYLEKIQILKVIKKTNIFDNIKFDLEIYWEFENNDFICYNWIDWDMIYSVSYFIKAK